MPSDGPQSIRVGQTLSHYQIVAAIGAGGMGEVYRATDLNLHRDVAIKILPAQVAQDADRLSRFRREAHLLAALNHPNIAAIYGLEEADGHPFLALELVDGEDLSERLKHGAVPVDEALAIALQVAEALEEAHNKGIVHRDLKPANVKLTPDGKVKVLDFGLAKAWAGGATDGSSASAEVSQSPTLAFTGTVAGVILGTAAYMSPEQARGKPVDKRSDVWAFGVLLWEMLVGRRLFTGDTITDIIAAVVTREPDLAALPKATPPAVRRLVARCLQKDPRRRLPDMGTARLELQDVLSGVTGAESAPAPTDDNVIRVARAARTRERWAWAVLALSLAGTAGYLVFQPRGTMPRTQSAAHFVLDTPETLSFYDFPDQLAMSPDGRNLVFSATATDGTRRLWIRPLDSVEVRPLPGTEEAFAPFWSPDSDSVAFFAGGELRKLALSGGRVQRICAVSGTLIAGGTWSDTGTIVFSNGGNSATLYQVPAAGGNLAPLTTLDPSRGETGHWWPRFLPGGREMLVLVGNKQAAQSGLYALSLDKPAERRLVLPGVGRFEYAAGNILAVEQGVLTARAFDPKRLTTGMPVTLASGAAVWNNDRSWGAFSASTNGHVAWLSAATTDLQLEWIDRDGKPLGTLGERGKYGQVVISPDDRRVAVEVAGADARYDLWIFDVARGVASRLTTDPANERDPVWSPDSKEIVFSSDAGEDQNLLRTSLLGSQSPAPLPGGAGQTPGKRDIAESWLREGNTLVYMVQGSEGERTLNALSLDGKGPTEVLSTDHFASDAHHVSPDGRWLAYVSLESGRFDVYVGPFRGAGEKVRVSPSGGGQPRWRGDGKEIFYLSPDGRLMAASVRETAAGLEVGIPATLVPADRLKAVTEGMDYDDYAVTSDGKRFLVKVSASKDGRQQIHMLLDWTPSIQ